jgi:hypothetical protein
MRWLMIACWCVALPVVRAGEVAPCPATPVLPGSAGAPSNVRLVTGAPYSALGTSESVTTLPDGKRVVHHNLIRRWRDRDGRTRSEISLTAVGGNLPVELNTTVTVIDDPAARERYMLRPGDKVAVTVPIVPCVADPGTLEPDLVVGPPRPARLPIRMSAPVTLGERELDGEKVAGRRIEATIPVGAVGNPQPINMSAEQWYGKDLQVVVEATYRDPRTETRYRLSEIDRAEPDASLFTVPESYRREPRRGSRR